MVGVLFLLIAASQSAAIPLLDAKSVRPVADFGACFTRAEERSGRAWAFMPRAHGGTFTDSGARGAPASYWLQVRGAGAATHVRLFGAGSAAASSPVIEAVEQCR
ncbi:MAG: hypothetical protein ABI853_05265 [Sphingomicrobium sp.]